MCSESQDVHTPPVIASVFQSRARGGTSQPPPPAGLRPSVMDEEDGKTGARARQSGQWNASEGVPAQSLCLFRLRSATIFRTKFCNSARVDPCRKAAKITTGFCPAELLACAQQICPPEGAVAFRPLKSRRAQHLAFRPGHAQTLSSGTKCQGMTSVVPQKPAKLIRALARAQSSRRIDFSTQAQPSLNPRSTP